MLIAAAAFLYQSSERNLALLFDFEDVADERLVGLLETM
jgi:hypothetical protein